MSSLNLARIVHRLLSDPLGWRVSDLCSELGIAPRTYRKYRKLLQEEFQPFAHGGGCRLEEVLESDGRYLRLKGTSSRKRISSPHQLGVFASHNLTPRSIRQALRAGASLAWSERQLIGIHLGENADRLLWTTEHPEAASARRIDVLSQLFSSLLRRTRVEVRYESGRARGELLEPLTLACAQGRLHVVLRRPRRGDCRALALERIEEVRETQQRFDYPQDGQYSPGRVAL